MEGFEGSGSGLSQQRFEFGEGQFNGIEVRVTGREEAQGEVGCLEGDWVAPHGKGKRADVFFRGELPRSMDMKTPWRWFSAELVTALLSTIRPNHAPFWSEFEP